MWSPFSIKKGNGASPSWSKVLTLSTLAALAPLSEAQFPPSQAVGLKTVTSPSNPNIKISYREPNDVCTTAFREQKQYTGWVTVPGEYPTHLFFWFVGAREPTSALTMMLNGGPGASSMFGLFAENGPCQVVEKSANRLETAAREWGWDRASNMLFVDQPNQVGFSYDTPTNGSLDLTTGMSSPNMQLPEGLPPNLFLNGTFSSSNIQNTANTTQNAATAVYHLLQGLGSAFPKYVPDKNGPLGVNLFTESYGGHYGPVFADVWVKENDKLKKRAFPLSKRQDDAQSRSTKAGNLEIKLTSLGIMNGCIDDLVQGSRYVEMAVNNTYGIKLIDQATADAITAGFNAPETGCKDLILACRQAQAALDPLDQGADETVNQVCAYAALTCQQLLGSVLATGVNAYDIAHVGPDAFPDYHYLEYLNLRRVQEAIGSVINYTDVSPVVYQAFFQTGDRARGGLIGKLASLLQRGVRIGLVYGDRDYICNWMGGESVSLAVAEAVRDIDPKSPYPTQFAQAGYAPIQVNGREAGAVRQFGNLSFSRIYQAGHYVPAYQPETAFRVFERVISGQAVSNGARVNLGEYATQGPKKADKQLTPPNEVVAKCFLRNLGATCTQEQVEAILQGQGVVINGVWYKEQKDWKLVTARSETAVAEGSKMKRSFFG
ncbi:Alpha/Beta hydrolase protein [Pseudoneurospora amorphoporcata]|uniref:Carboxypeptidase n=1 Tax=Pseudoneurospora amorphoporcata TaxID=241081 RepID=A0AAN6P0S0_9PEZI|nr:Alpha/Beta hydrolase protein [Pseudoneurospora amorphoporcata]